MAGQSKNRSLFHYGFIVKSLNWHTKQLPLNCTKKVVAPNPKEISMKSYKCVNGSVLRRLKLYSMQASPCNRGEDAAHWKKILKEFWDLAALPIMVNFRDGKYYIINGQHTRLVLLAMGYLEYDAQVFQVSEAEEARLYTLFNSAPKKLNSVDMFYGAYIGEIQEALDVVRLAHAKGFTLQRVDLSASISFPQPWVLITVYRKFKDMQNYSAENLFNRYLTCLQTWKGQEAATAGHFLRALADFVKITKDFDTKELQVILKGTSASAITSDALNNMSEDNKGGGALIGYIKQELIALIPNDTLWCKGLFRYLPDGYNPLAKRIAA